MTTPHQQPGAPVPEYAAPVDYTSPIPIRRATLGDALASEWTKIRSVRSTMWTLGVMVALLVGIGFLVALAVRTTDDTFQRDDVLTLGFFGTLLGSICVITLGVLTIASEYGTGLIRTTLTACPNRARVLTAKAIVYFLLVFGVTVVTTLLVGAMQVGMLGGEPNGSQWFRATLGV
ncbi:ABC transporter permease, partial [Streptomyces sp. NPDC003860]